MSWPLISHAQEVFEVASKSCWFPTPLRLLVPFQIREVRGGFYLFIYLVIHSFIHLIQSKTYQAVKQHRFYV